MACCNAYADCTHNCVHPDNPCHPPIPPAPPFPPAPPRPPFPPYPPACCPCEEAGPIQPLPPYFPDWPMYCSHAHYCCAGSAEGGTLVIHKIVLTATGNQVCEARTFHIRITGPSYPCGEVFSLRAGSCLELDEPLVLTGLEPGCYTIEEIYACPHEYLSTLTGPVCGRCVHIANAWQPTVVTIVSRHRGCGCHAQGCGCHASICC